MSTLIDLTAEPLQAATYGSTQRERVGFFTDTTLCIGCKACEVACKQWNQLPADGYTFTAQSYDNTKELSG
ncbi:MAG TPA: 4Fe-4S binding protein, partial [Candidatus Rubrimentiphilum sp.]|nr:4Fe-4S binding protein [Candidatus Rubrimentiphilum sp.]